MNNKRLHGTLGVYLGWPWLFLPIFIVLTVHLGVKWGFEAALVGCIYLAIYVAFALVIFFSRRRSLLKDIVQYAVNFDHKLESVIGDMNIPVAITDCDGLCFWNNASFKTVFCDENTPETFPISGVIDILNAESFPKEYGEEKELRFSRGDKFYKAVMKKVNVTDDKDDMSGRADVGIGDHLVMISILDETEINYYKHVNKEQRMDVGVLYIDNYAEALEPLEELKRAVFSGIIDRKINTYMSKIDAITKKMEKDKYIFLFQHKYLKVLEEEKFSILDEIRNLDENGGVNATVSIGIGIEDESYKKRQEYARSAIDMALARGGDQVVIKTADNLVYYGGKSIQQEKNTRVKARVKAKALREAIENADMVLAMGHRLPDADAVGSAIGIYRIAKSLGKESHIVVNTVTSSLRPIVNMINENKDESEEVFVTGEKARTLITPNTLLVIVDVNNQPYTDEPDLVDLVPGYVVIDHHRQTSEAFKNPILSYVEPFASSACEMVAEILQYVGEEVKLQMCEADAMYSGIMVDTNNFMNKPGVRTFEAVAYLRRCGADVLRIRKLFRSGIEEYKVKAQAIQNTEIFLKHYAIAVCSANTLESPMIVGAQAANELLNLEGVKGSFVLTEFEEKIYISARSIDEMNVQIVMERMGGGGHISSAGAQLEGVSLRGAAEKLKATILSMFNAGELDN